MGKPDGGRREEGGALLSERYYKSHNENLTISTERARADGAAATRLRPRLRRASAARKMNFIPRYTTSRLIPLFTFAFRTRARIQLWDAILQDALSGQ